MIDQDAIEQLGTEEERSGLSCRVRPSHLSGKRPGTHLLFLVEPLFDIVAEGLNLFHGAFLGCDFEHSLLETTGAKTGL